MYGNLGYGNLLNIGDNEAPRLAGDVSVGGLVSDVAAGNGMSCALLTSGEVRCWGMCSSGRLGIQSCSSNVGDNELPSSTSVVDVGGTVTKISAQSTHVCVLLSTGNVRCWGSNNFGQLGYGHTLSIGGNEAPSTAGDVNLGGATATQVAVGTVHTCALLSTGDVKCWGCGGMGQLGYGNTNMIGDNELPNTVGNVDLGGIAATQIAAGRNFSCALLSTQNVICWGEDSTGMTGRGNTFIVGDSEVPATLGSVPLF